MPLGNNSIIHSNLSFRQTLEATAALKLEEVETQALQCDVIGIDEGQFVCELIKMYFYLLI